MAFVSSVGSLTGHVAGAKCSGFTGSAISTAVPKGKATIMMGAGNQALGSLGLDKFMDKYMVQGVPMNQVAPTEYKTVIDAIYAHVFANAYIMESERAEMAVPESQFKLGELTVKEFVMALAMTEEYQRRFFDNRPLYGAIEMNFKHFLGRTPDGLEEYRAKSAVYDAKGYAKFVQAFFDDGEYDLAFGDWMVPFYRGYKTECNLSMAAFTHFFKVVRGGSTSDKGSITNAIPLNSKGIRSIPIPVTEPGRPVFMEGFVAPGASGNSTNSAPASKFGAVPGPLYRIEITKYGQTAVRGRSGVSAVGKVYTRANGYSTFARANKAIVCSKDELNKKFQEITRNGGKICSITPV
mmetsp:Transcript_11885/g.17209  ORF Transcript_11885/g.17209 Transcript_11885/m.17209 type:complete len:352 (-) Transcript_11885:120-1175(-)